MAAELKVVDLAGPADIPEMLRDAADRIEAGEHPELRFIVSVFVERDVGVTVYGWGEMSCLEGIGALMRAASIRLND